MTPPDSMLLSILIPVDLDHVVEALRALEVVAGVANGRLGEVS